MKLKLGLDIGIASVGWGIIDENYDVKNSGVRLFSECSPAENEVRRTMRGQRRRLRRRQHRLLRMGKCLSEILNMDYPEPVGNVYEIRCRGIREKITKAELFLAIMHLAKFRGTHFLTAEDFQKDSDGNVLGDSLVDLDDSQYVCEIQYEYFQTHGNIRGTERNHFRNKDYKRELAKLLEVQSAYYHELDAEALHEITEIYSSKREYYDGPGSEKSPTPYGCWRYDTDGNLKHVNIIDEMRGYCTYYPDEKRIAKASYTASLFNLLNDLNNLSIDGRKLSYEEKQQLITEYVDRGKSITEKAIQQVANVQDGITGYRIDSKGKPLFTSFDGYKKILKVYKDKNIDVGFIQGNRSKVDEIADILTAEKNSDEAKKRLDEAGFASVSDELVKLPGFSQYHALSKKAMEAILADLWHTDKNQMQLFSEAGMKPAKNKVVKGKSIKLDMSDWIVSPVTLRAVNETIKVINAARAWVRKHYQQDFAEIIIEMPRDKNGDEAKKRITNLQKENKKQHEIINELVNGKKINGKTFLALKLLREQNFKCAYSGQAITVADVLNGTRHVEIDHIIPISISFDDSLSNKVAVLREENQDKGCRTPFQYFHSGKSKISWQEYCDDIAKNKNYSQKKKANLLYQGDLNKDLLGFVGRNISDTRYASRKVLNALQDYFRENQLATKVKVVNGSFTYQFRKRAELGKNREETYAHHAQDALIIVGLSNIAIMRFLGDILCKDIKAMADKESLVFEDGRLINKVSGEVLTDAYFADKAQSYIRFIKHIEHVQPKYSFKVDRKPNRQLYDQQVKATRVKKNEKGVSEPWIVTKYKDIYATGSSATAKNLATLIIKEPERILMYHHDIKTFELFKKIVEYYPNEENPFAAYKDEHGYIRKYAKKGNGPIIRDVKFLDRRLGNHRMNNHLDGKNVSVYLSVKTLRADIYCQNGAYCIVAVPYDMLDCMTDGYKINEEKYAAAKQEKKLGDRAEFCFSLYRGECFSYVDRDGKPWKWIYICVADGNKNTVEMKPIDKPHSSKERDKKTIGKNTLEMTKYHVDVLGNEYPVKKEKFVDFFPL